ncbi:tRNA (adenosine(37)-N6)-dimethylallyltransferase MiaA [Patescibacteria group bacterium]|nr:tRNA (adenosine(37)-N6)-dimethylallyltransferase MiaA [Patescibacteria group bacterium]
MHIIVIVGPTATGKSALAVHLAKKFYGEIISADSRQIYRGLDIGTEKITEKEMGGIPHHLLSIADPKHRYTVTDFKHDATEAVRYIVQKGKLPIVVGGTGFYIQALVDGIDFPSVPPNPVLRKTLGAKTVDELVRNLQKLDPARVDTIDVKNRRRLVRAIEIAKATGQVPPIHSKPNYNALFIGLLIDRDQLRSRINKRLAGTLKKGLVEETKKLLDVLPHERINELGLEYRIVTRFIRDEITEEETRKLLEYELWHYAKRQMTWFKRDKRILWFNSTDTRKIEAAVRKFLAD